MYSACAYRARAARRRLASSCTERCEPLTPVWRAKSSSSSNVWPTRSVLTTSRGFVVIQMFVTRTCWLTSRDIVVICLMKFCCHTVFEYGRMETLPFYLYCSRVVQMRPDIKKFVFHLCWAGDKVPAEDVRTTTVHHVLLRDTFL